MLIAHNLKKYIFFSSEGYTIDDVIYAWTIPDNSKSIVTASDMTLSQFDLIGWSHKNETKIRYSGTCMYS